MLWHKVRQSRGEAGSDLSCHWPDGASGQVCLPVLPCKRAQLENMSVRALNNSSLALVTSEELGLKQKHGPVPEASSADVDGINIWASFETCTVKHLLFSFFPVNSYGCLGVEVRPLHCQTPPAVLFCTYTGERSTWLGLVHGIEHSCGMQTNLSPVITAANSQTKACLEMWMFFHSLL